MVAAMPNPLPGMRTLSSNARAMFWRRAVTVAMSSRMTTSPCVGTSNRSSRPRSSAQSSAATGCRVVEGEREPRRPHRAALRLDALALEPARLDRDLGLRRDVGCERDGLLGALDEAHGQRLVRREEEVGQHEGVRGTWSVFWPVWVSWVMSLVAVVPANDVRMFSPVPRTVASMTSSMGRQSAV
jgi:hypothetical protein